MLLLKINYTTSLDRAVKSVRYHAFRSREVDADRKGIFDRSSDHADVRSFINRLDDPLTRDRVTRRGRKITPPKIHRLMFSLSRREFEACGFTSWKPVIRDAMESLERQHGFRLDWVAAEHNTANHPHVHVDIKSVYTAADGTRHRLAIRHDMRKAFRQAVEQVMERERSRAREERRQLREMDRAIHDITTGLLRVLREAGREDPRDDALPHRRRRRQSHERDTGDRGR